MLKINERAFEYYVKLEQTKAFVVQNYTERIIVGDVAKFVNLSPKYFLRFFHRHVGVPFGLYLDHLRIEKAKELIQTDDHLSLLAVSEEVGFSAYRTFERAFLRIENQTPHQFKTSVQP